MAWTDYFIEKLPNAKLVVSGHGEAFVSIKLAPSEFVMVEMEIGDDSCPFSVWYREYDALGNIREERRYGKAGTKDIARQLALEVANLRLNSKEFVLDGE